MLNHLYSFLCRNLVFALVFLIALFAAAPGWSQTFPEKPPDKDFFVDQAGLIKPEEAKEINQIASKLLVEERIPIFVVTISSLAGMDASAMSIETYAAKLFDEWGIGFEDRNNGMLLLVAQLDRKARIELGADWDHRFDFDALKVMDTLIIPKFKERNFSLGILEGVRGMEAMARGLQLPKPEQPWWVLPLFIAAVIGVILLIINLFKTGRSGWAWALIAFLGIMIFFMLRNAGSSGGSGGGFGGGFSGGGGATGSW